MPVLEHLEQTARDGRMSRDLECPVAGWRVTNKPGRIKRSFVVRAVHPTATQLPVYPTRPTGNPVFPVVPSVMPSEGDGIRPGKVTREPEWDGDGLQPSPRITGKPVQGRTTPLPSDHISKRPVVGGATAKSGASSVSGASNSWLTVASSVLALTVVTLPTVDRTMRRMSTETDEKPPTTERRTTSQSASKEPRGDLKTWSTDDTAKLDAGRSPETDRANWKTKWSDEVASNTTTSPTVDSDSVNLSTDVDSTAVFAAHRTTTTTTTGPTTTTTPQLLPQTSLQHNSRSITHFFDTLTTTTTTLRSRKKTRRPKLRPRTRRPSRKRTRAPRVDYAPVVRRRLGKVVVNAGDVLFHVIANDTFVDYQVSRLSSTTYALLFRTVERFA